MLGTGATRFVTAVRRKVLARRQGSRRSPFRPRHLKRRVRCRSFYLDLALLEDYWLRRKYHHTISAPLVLALNEALAVVEEEGLEARHARHQQNHLALVEGLDRAGALAAPSRRRAAVDAQRRSRAGRCERGSGATAAPAEGRHRDRGRPRSSCGTDLAGWLDGSRIDACERRPVPLSVRYGRCGLPHGITPLPFAVRRKGR